MANVNPLKYDKPLSMRVDQEFLDMLDAVRSRRRPIPTRADLIREAIQDLAERELPKRRAR